MANNLDVGPGPCGALQPSLVEFSWHDQFTAVILATRTRNSFHLAQVKGDLTGRFLFVFLFHLLEDNCFTMLWWSLPHIDAHRSSLYTYPAAFIPLGHPTAPGWAPCYIPARYLFHMAVCTCHATFSSCPTLSFPHRVHETVLYVCVSISSL